MIDETKEKQKEKRKNEGKIFEKDFIDSFNKDVYVYRLRDSSSAWGGDKSNDKVRFTAKNICDFIAFTNGELLLLELKTCAGTSLPFGNITNNQLKELDKATKYDNVRPLFIINFRKFNETYAIEAYKVKEYVDAAERKSFAISWMRENGIEIKGIKKRTRYRYKLESLIYL